MYDWIGCFAPVDAMHTIADTGACRIGTVPVITGCSAPGHGGAG